MVERGVISFSSLPDVHTEVALIDAGSALKHVHTRQLRPVDIPSCIVLERARAANHPMHLLPTHRCSK